MYQYRVAFQDMTIQDRKLLLRPFRSMMVPYTGASVVAAGLQLRLPIALTSEDQSRKISQIASVALMVYGGEALGENGDDWRLTTWGIADKQS